jgi:hypothetical protein
LAIILSPLLVAAVLPVWTVWCIGPREANGEYGMIWSAVRMLPANLREVGVTDFITSYTFDNVAKAVILLLLGIGIDRHYLLKRPERRAALGLCPACGYDIRATPERCPECGAVPDDAAAH